MILRIPAIILAAITLSVVPTRAAPVIWEFKELKLRGDNEIPTLGGGSNGLPGPAAFVSRAVGQDIARDLATSRLEQPPTPIEHGIGHEYPPAEYHNPANSGSQWPVGVARARIKGWKNPPPRASPARRRKAIANSGGICQDPAEDHNPANSSSQWPTGVARARVKGWKNFPRCRPTQWRRAVANWGRLRIAIARSRRLSAAADRAAATQRAQRAAEKGKEIPSEPSEHH